MFVLMFFCKSFYRCLVYGHAIFYNLNKVSFCSFDAIEAVKLEQIHVT